MPTLTDEPLIVERVPIDSVREHPENARDDASMDVVRESIDVHGQYAPILVQRSTGLIAKGNHTHRVLVERGDSHVDVIRREMSDDHCRRIMLVDNASSDGAGYRHDSLAALLQSLDGDYTGTGYSAESLDELMRELDPPAPEGETLDDVLPAPFSDDELIEAAFVHFRTVGFPYPLVPRFQALQEINALARSEPDVLANTLAAYHVADPYQLHRFTVRVPGHRTPIEQFERDEILRYALRWTLDDGKRITPGTLRQALAMVRSAQLAAQFRPGFALWLYRRFCPQGGTLLDTSTGFGGRLIAFMASHCDRYIGIDPEPRTCAGNRKMVDELCPTGKGVEIIEAPAEDVPHERVAGLADFAFTSPPYFGKEQYSDDPEQSWKRYPEPELWRRGFLGPMLALQWAALKPGAYNVVNIADVNVRGTAVPLEDWTIEAARQLGFVVHERERMPLSRVPGRGETAELGEAVLIFQKPV